MGAALSADSSRSTTRGATRPTDDHSFDGCFERLALAGRDCVVVAVSGGSDSLALLHLFADFAQQRHPSMKVVAVTVDHGLRAEAAEEARQVGALAMRRGVRHVIKRWQGGKPQSGLMEAAREARHRLLAEAAHEAGADLVLVGHTLDDQAETVAMRGKRGGGRGVSGMAEATLYDWSTWFARPLLGVRRAAMRRVLSEAGIGWIDDPSNEDARYERARIRTALGDEAIEALVVEARQAAAGREALGRRAAGIIARHASMPARGLIRLDPAFAEERDGAASVYALRILLAIAGGQNHLPDETRAEKLMERLRLGPVRATLSRAVAERRKAGVFLHREQRNLPVTAVLGPGEVWDGRFRLAGQGREGLSVGAPDGATVAALVEAAPDNVPAPLVRAAAASLPALWAQGECIGLAADQRNISCKPQVGPWARYLPSLDFEPARAAARLIGASEPSVPPFDYHKGRKA